MSMLFDLINDVKPPEVKQLEDIDIVNAPTSGFTPYYSTGNAVAKSRSATGSMWASTSPVKHVDATVAAKNAFKYYTDKGIDRKVAAGVVGNLFRESGLNPNAVGDNGTSFGVAQWHNERFNGLKRFASKHGKNWQDTNTQLDYAIAEQPNTISKMQRSANERQAAEIFTDEFERPNPKYAAKDVRIGMASTLYKMAYGGPPKARSSFTADQGAAIGSGLNLIGDLTQSFDTNKNYSDRTLSTVGGALKGAGTGAAIGSSISPVIGTVIGAGIGAIAGGISGNKKAKREKKMYDDEVDMGSSNFLNSMRLRTDAMMPNYNGKPMLRYGGGGSTSKKKVTKSVANPVLQNEKQSGANKLNTNWIRKKVPDAIEQFYDHAMGSVDSITTIDKDLQQQYLKIIDKKKDQLLRYGKAKIGYGDYEKNYVPNSNDTTGLEKDYLSPKWNAANLTGSATLRKKGKDVILEDTYDFNEPAYKDDVSNLRRFVGFVTNDNPNPKLSKPVQDSFKQRAERYFGRSKGSPVKITFGGIYN